MEAEPDADVLMRFDNAKPALVERSIGQGRVLLFASSLDPEWNNLPLQGLYLPFVHETLRYLVHHAEKQRAYQVGDLIDMEPESGGTVLVSEPDGGSTRLAGNYSYTAHTPGVVGVITQNGGNSSEQELTRYYAINADPEESNLAKVAVVDVLDMVINPDTEPVQSKEVRTAQLLKEMEKPQRLWWWVLGLVMLLLLTEAHIANRTYR